LGIGANGSAAFIGAGGYGGPSGGGGGGSGGAGGAGESGSAGQAAGGAYGGGGSGASAGDGGPPGGVGALRIIWPSTRIADGTAVRAFGNGTTVATLLATDQSGTIAENLSLFNLTIPTSYLTNLDQANTWTIQFWDPEVIPQSLVTTPFPPINPRERLYWTNLTSKYSSLTGVDANKDTTEVVYDRDTKGIVVKFRTAALGQGVQDPAYKSVAPIQFWN
jgi:hypothetical protein